MSETGGVPGNAPKEARKWRGPESGAPGVSRYRWQDRGRHEPLGQVVLRERRQSLKALGLLAGGLALLGAFVWYLLFFPERTPLVAVFGQRYEWPLAPNAFALEDLQALQTLDGENLCLVDLSSQWRSAEQGLAALDRQLAELAKQSPARGAVILYLSMHGVLDGEGRPCLIPPGAAPLDSRGWLRVADLLERIKAASNLESRPKLLVLDAARMSMNWRIGLLYNGFAARLEATVAAAAVPGLVVLNSAHEGQTGWAAAELSGTAFGHFFRRGLAGEADDQGDGDGAVNLHELLAYLDEHVDRWAQTNRAAHQQPLLVPEEAADFELTWSLGKGWRRRDAAATRPTSPLVPTERLTGLWRGYEKLLAARPYTHDPLGWRDFEQGLLSLERLSTAGRGAESDAASLAMRLTTQAAAMQQRLEQLQTTPSLAGWAELVSGRASNIPSSLPAHSLPLAAELAQLPPDAPRLRETLGHLATSVSHDDLARGIADLQAAPVLAEVHLLRMLDRWQTDSWWKQPDIVAQVIKTGVEGELAAVPADWRVLPLVHGWVTRGDAARRVALDRLLSGDEVSLTIAREQSAQALTHYASAQHQGARLAEAFATRDRAWALLPYMAEWLGRDVPAAAAADQNRQLQQVILPLIEDALALSVVLNRSPAGAEGELSDAIADAQRVVREKLKLLDDELTQVTARLTGLAATSAQTWREIDALLGVPVLPAEGRTQLRARQAQIAAQLTSTTGQPSTAADKPTSGDAPNAYLQRVTLEWPTHPALALVRRPETATATKQTKGSERSDLLTIVAVQGEQLRTILNGIPAELDRLRATLPVELPADNQTDAAEIGSRPPLIAAAMLARRAAAMWFPAVAVDPVADLRRIDLRLALLGQAQRALDDFWGPFAEGQVPFFERAANDYLQAIRLLGPNQQGGPGGSQRLEALLASRRLAARSGLETTAADVLLIGPDQPADFRWQLRRPADDAGNSLPAGLAAVFARDRQGRLSGTSQSVELSGLPVSTDELRKIDFSAPATELAKRGPAVDAVALFRGQAYVAPFLLRDSGGHRSDFEPYRYLAPRVRVSAAEREPLSIVFILDCSASMGEAVAVEAPEQEKGKLTRLHAATNALQTMLDQLAEQGNARVGVRFYGHRVGWNTREPNQVLRQTKYGLPIPDGLIPSQDVELVLPLGRFDHSVEGQVTDLLKSLKPWGETPLYLALTQALTDFTQDDSDTQRRIVVITDGVNNQFNAPQSSTREDVLAADHQAKIPIHIVGFDIPAADAAEAERDFGQIAKETKGSYVPVAGASGLIKSLDELLGPRRFEVHDAADQLIGAAPVGEQVEIPLDPPGASATFRVSLREASAEIEVQGGESVDLQPDRTAMTLDSARLERGSPKFLPLTLGSGLRKSDVELGIHRPIGLPEGVRFLFSLVRSDRKYMPRPAEAWIEIRPLESGRPSDAPYLFYDSNFEPDMPCPVLEWLATDWPAAARQAEIRASFKMMRSPETRVSVGSLANRAPDQGSGATLEGLPGFTYQIRARRGEQGGELYRVDVVERYAADSAGVGAVKVELLPRPRRVVHRFDAPNRIAVHTFYVAADDRTIGTYEVVFTRRRDMQADAILLREPAVIDISDASDVIRLAPPSGGPELRPVERSAIR